MSIWWQNLSLSGQFFWGAAIFGSVLQLFVLAGTLFGGPDDLDHSAGAHDGTAVDGGDVSHGVKVISFRAVVAFLVGFGWAGALALAREWSLEHAWMMAVGTGLVFALLLYATMRLLVSMRSEGTLDYRNAVGQSGRVYVTVPALRHGPGQVELMLQGRLITAQAVTDGAEALAPFTPVRVRSLTGGTTLVVESAPAG